MAQFTLLATVLPLLNPEAHGVAHHTLTFAEYILQSLMNSNLFFLFTHTLHVFIG